MARQQLQQMHRLREKWKVQWYFYHYYDSHWTIYYSLHPKYNTDSDLTLSQIVYVILTNIGKVDTKSSVHNILHIIYTTKRQLEYHQYFLPVYVSLHLTINKQYLY